MFVSLKEYAYNTAWMSTLGQDSVVFKVAACKEANIVLAQYPGITGVNAYEVSTEVDTEVGSTELSRY